MLINELNIRIIRILFCWKNEKYENGNSVLWQWAPIQKFHMHEKKTTTIHENCKKNNPMEIKFNRNSSVNKNRFLFMTEIICALPNSLHLFFELHVDGVDFDSCFVWFPLFIWNFRGFCLLWNNCVYGEYITMRGTEFVNQCGLYRYFCRTKKIGYCLRTIWTAKFHNTAGISFFWIKYSDMIFPRIFGAINAAE